MLNLDTHVLLHALRGGLTRRERGLLEKQSWSISAEWPEPSLPLTFGRSTSKSVAASAGVEFVLVGGVAAAAHGSPRSTQVLDVVYGRRLENLEALVRALRPHQPYPKFVTTTR